VERLPYCLGRRKLHQCGNHYPQGRYFKSVAGLDQPCTNSSDDIRRCLEQDFGVWGYGSDLLYDEAVSVYRYSDTVAVAERDLSARLRPIIAKHQHRTRQEPPLLLPQLASSLRNSSAATIAQGDYLLKQGKNAPPSVR
jgi:hypothetical protein